MSLRNNYVEIVRRELALHMDVGRELLDYYALLVLTRGEKTTNQDVHDAWAVWRSKHKPNHPSIRPYKRLDREIQELDTPYRDAIREVAKILPLL